MVVVQLVGGLGNQMFQYACGMHLAHKNKTRLVLDLSFIKNRMPVKEGFVYRDFELDIFTISSGISDGSEFPLFPGNWRINNRIARLIHLFQVKMRGFKYVMEINRKEYDKLLYKPKILQKRGDIYLVGYWVSEKYFKPIEKLIRQEFNFKHPVIETSIDLLNEIESTNSVCLHVRRTDLLNVKEMGFHGVDYYKRGLDELSKKVSDLKLFVFSDDLEWCKTNFDFNFPTEFVGHEHDGVKNSNALQLMTKCKHFIIPNSSYSWWAAYLAKNPSKIVVTPREYYNGWNSDDIVPPEWVRL